MATLRTPCDIERSDSGVPLDLVSNQITSAAAPSIGNLTAWVMADGGADEGVYGTVEIPQNYVSGAKLRIRGILDGAPGAGDDLGFGFRKRATADNESADGTFDAEQTTQNTDIGSTGTNHSNEDLYQADITLTDGDYAAGDEVDFYFFIDASGTTYTGNFLLRSLDFVYNDA